jgi:hypothetical protein
VTIKTQAAAVAKLPRYGEVSWSRLPKLSFGHAPNTSFG